MRILGFTKKWDKLEKQEFTTFRFPRKDKDWYIGELVQIVFKSRSKEREILGVAEIINKEYPKYGPETDEEAVDDGFKDIAEMERFMVKMYGYARTWQPMNKLTLKWNQHENY